jgi:hypothetical protein
METHCFSHAVSTSLESKALVFVCVGLQDRASRPSDGSRAGCPAKYCSGSGGCSSGPEGFGMENLNSAAMGLAARRGGSLVEVEDE